VNVLTWNETLSVGVQPIDDEHRELFDFLTALEAATKQSMEPESAARLLRELEEATRKHFAVEETVMRTAKYPGLVLHRANHLRLMEKLEAFSSRYGRGGQSLNQHALNFLGDWLVNHIQTDDLRLGDWLREHKLF
jgi:hemerythrin